MDKAREDSQLGGPLAGRIVVIGPSEGKSIALLRGHEAYQSVAAAFGFVTYKLSMRRGAAMNAGLTKSASCLP